MASTLWHLKYILNINFEISNLVIDLDRIDDTNNNYNNKDSKVVNLSYINTKETFYLANGR